MSKVYDALQRARADQNLIGRIERDAMIGSLMPEIVGFRGLPQPKMGEEMSRLLRHIVALLPDAQRSIIQFIGSRKAEGTSTILREFGLFAAMQLNKSVLLVEGDHSQLPQHHVFEVQSQISLQRIMNDGGSVDQAICQVKSSRIFLCRFAETNQANFRSSYLVNNQEVWSKLRKAFDFVLIDSPPLTSSEDALAHCAFADGVLLIVEADRTRSQVALNLKDRVTQAGGNVLGVVFNKQRHYIPKWIYKRL